MKHRVTNTHDSPYGIHDVNGVVRVIQPGKSMDIELSEAEAAELMRGKGVLKVSRQRVALRDDQDNQENDDGESEADSAESESESDTGAEAGSTGVVAPAGNAPGKGQRVVNVPRGGRRGRKGPASGR